MVRIKPEALRFGFPYFADVFVWREPPQGLQAAGRIVCTDEVFEMRFELLVAVVVVSLDGSFLDGAVPNQRALVLGVQAIVQRQQGMAAEGHDDGLLLDTQHRGFGFLRPRRQIADGSAFLPLGNRFGVDPVTLGKGPRALLTILYCSTDCLCRRGAAV